MKCPRCGAEELSVIDSRSDGSAIRRRRECEACNSRFTSYERIELSLPMIIKKDSRREPFDREKIRAGLLRACEKTSIGMEDIELLVDTVEGKVAELCVKEVPSRQIGDYLMAVLRERDKVAYVRFASVYREFSDVSQFVDTLQSLEKAPAPKSTSLNDKKVGNA